MRETTQIESSHVWRTGRFLPAFDPEHFRVDERTGAELMLRAARYARMLTYFDEEDVAHLPPEGAEIGAWEAFFRGDVAFLLAEIATCDAAADYKAARDLDERALGALSRQAFARLADWVERAYALQEARPDGRIETDLAESLSQVVQRELSAAAPAGFGDLVNRSSGPARALLLEAVDTAANARGGRLLFSALNRVQGQLAATARQYLERSLTRDDGHPAHTALYLAFLELFSRSQADLNRMTDRHLDYYYRRVLRLSPGPAAPDTAIVRLEATDGVRMATAPEGALLMGQAAGATLFYRTTRPLTVTRARVVAAQALRIEPATGAPDRGAVAAVLAFPELVPADRIGVSGGRPWSPFGPGGRMATADAHAFTGVAMASPYLRLSEGERRVEVSIGFTGAGQRRFSEAAAAYAASAGCATGDFPDDALALSLSSSRGFFGATGVTATLDAAGDALKLGFALAKSAPPVEPPAGEPAVSEPLLRLALNPSAKVYAWRLFHDMRISRVEFDVRVSGLTRLALHGATGPIDPTKPFPPFGAQPLPGDGFVFGSDEMRRKSITAVRLTATWAGLPPAPADFAHHYSGYGVEAANDDFRLALSVGDGPGWRAASVDAGRGSGEGPDRRREARAQSLAIFSVTRSCVSARADYAFDLAPPAPAAPPSASAPPPFRPNATTGFFRLALAGPTYGFGQALYADVLAARAVENSGKIASLSLFSGKPAPLPKPPLLPKIAALTLDYSAASGPETVGAPGGAKIFALDPFGPMRASASSRMIEDDRRPGAVLFLGLADASPGEVVNLFFEIVDTASMEQKLGVSDRSRMLDWAYLSGDGWRDLPGEAMLEDGTFGLTGAGVVRVALPGDLVADQRRDPAGLAWISISASGAIDGFGDIRSILTQVVPARRVLPADPAPGGSEAPPDAPAGAITKLVGAIPGIKGVTQPFPTTGGRAAETREAFRIRVSERLRHKSRAVQALDYAQMIVEEFPDIADAKRVGLSGDGVVMAVTRVRSPGESRPTVGLARRRAIADWLSGRAGGVVGRVIVRNPAFEPIRVRAWIVADAGAGPDVVGRVEAAANRFIAPWRDDPSAPIPIGGARISPGAISTIIEKVPGVMRVAGLALSQTWRHDQAGRVSHGLKDTALRWRRREAMDEGVEPILASSSSASVLVPAERHDIVRLGSRLGIGQRSIGGDFTVVGVGEGGEGAMRPSPAGIGGLAVGEDLTVVDPDDAMPPLRRASRSTSDMIAFPPDAPDAEPKYGRNDAG